jgi:hypothetical protein
MLANPVFAAVRDLRNKTLAHAADALSRQAVKSSLNGVRMDDVAEAHKLLLQIVQIVSAGILNDTWLGEAIPVPQYDQFENLDATFIPTVHVDALRQLWEELGDERKKWLEEAFGMMPRFGNS